MPIEHSIKLATHDISIWGGIRFRAGLRFTAPSLCRWLQSGRGCSRPLSYGVDQVDPFRRAASYVDRVLRGEKPGDLPVQLPTKFEMVVNRKTATALGLAIPPSILLRADEVIE
jgi:hypothetical protein